VSAPLSSKLMAGKQRYSLSGQAGNLKLDVVILLNGLFKRLLKRRKDLIKMDSELTPAILISVRGGVRPTIKDCWSMALPRPVPLIARGQTSGVDEKSTEHLAFYLRQFLSGM